MVNWSDLFSLIETVAHLLELTMTFTLLFSDRRRKHRK